MAANCLLDDDPGQAVVDEIAADDDGMLVREAPAAEARAHYFACGRSALHAVRPALAAAGRAGVRRGPDFPCGHGRVLRTLVAAYPGPSSTPATCWPPGWRSAGTGSGRCPWGPTRTRAGCGCPGGTT